MIGIHLFVDPELIIWVFVVCWSWDLSLSDDKKSPIGFEEELPGASASTIWSPANVFSILTLSEVTGLLPKSSVIDYPWV